MVHGRQYAMWRLKLSQLSQVQRQRGELATGERSLHQPNKLDTLVTPTPTALVVPSPLHFPAKRNGDSRCTRVSHLNVSFESEVSTVDLPFLH
ncbi:hypothetical protein GHT06_007685 [Daphnia sinensis]|uniref:Uncharacterized protein n=1 Tax=Daphnia sinensis TaxID=1820382 RepID=A0AAD5L2Q8_9CRUS|nr:hypothetical protein GHT06_007685 [Daphnia sinensis]